MAAFAELLEHPLDDPDRAHSAAKHEHHVEFVRYELKIPPLEEVGRSFYLTLVPLKIQCLGFALLVLLAIGFEHVLRLEVGERGLVLLLDLLLRVDLLLFRHGRRFGRGGDGVGDAVTSRVKQTQDKQQTVDAGQTQKPTIRKTVRFHFWIPPLVFVRVPLGA